MTTERLPGGWLVYAIVGGFLIRRRYFGYTKREAIRMFRAECR